MIAINLERDLQLDSRSQIADPFQDCFKIENAILIVIIMEIIIIYNYIADSF